MHLYLAALKPPGNVEALVRPLQDHFMIHYGWTSVRALPPLLPLGYTGTGDDAAPGPPRAPELVVGGVDVGRDTITVPVHTAGAVSAAQGAPGPTGPEESARATEWVAGAATKVPQHFPRVGDGLFVGVNEGARSPSDMQNLPEVPVTRVRQWWYVVIDLEYEDPESWWMQLKWREVERTRLPKREAGG